MSPPNAPDPLFMELLAAAEDYLKPPTDASWASMERSDRLRAAVLRARHRYPASPPPEDSAEREETKTRLLKAALPLARTYGFDSISRGMVGRAAGVSDSLLSRYWKAPEFEAALIAYAIAEGDVTVLAQALARRHPVALTAPESLRCAAAEWLASE